MVTVESADHFLAGHTRHVADTAIAWLDTVRSHRGLKRDEGWTHHGGAFNPRLRFNPRWEGRQTAGVTGLRSRFPGVNGGWARFDGPAGTQMVDTAIAAMTQWASSGDNANCGGSFAAADACDALLERARASVGRLLGGTADGVVFGANMTTMTLAFSRAVGATLGPGDRIVGTRLDHDANVSPWRIAAERAGAEHVLAPFDPSHRPARSRSRSSTSSTSGPAGSRCPARRTSSARCRTSPRSSRPPTPSGPASSSTPSTWRPHRPIDVEALGADVLVTSPYKWYGPHAGVLWARPEILDDLPGGQGAPGRRPRAAPLGVGHAQLRGDRRRGGRGRVHDRRGCRPRWPRPRRRCSLPCSTVCSPPTA